MEKQEFSKIRKELGKTQSQMARILGTSLKAVQSFEQGWRNIPSHVERQLMFLQAVKGPLEKNAATCWTSQQCPIERRKNCPAWEFQLPSLCWFVNGTICKGEAQKDWGKKMEICRRCDVLRSALNPEG